LKNRFPNCRFIFYKQFLLLFALLWCGMLRAQYINTGDTTNAVLKPVPSRDTLFGNSDTLRVSADSLQRLQEALFKSSYDQNTGVAVKGKKGKTDTTHYSAKKAALWALACPGLGQIYNKKYWKLPIVYGLMGTMIYFLASNVNHLREYNGYIRNVFDSVPNPSPVDQLDLSEIETYRNTYRRNVQLSAFGTALVWGLSIVDAVVDAHLHAFEVSDKLSMKVKPQINSFDNAYYAGLAVNLTFK
jgi:hypothetical protein